MASYKKAVITEIVADAPDIVVLTVDAGGTKAKAVAYPALTGPVEVGDEVIVNTTAAELKLGSGGFHIVVWNLKYGDLEVPAKGHIVKLRYTPMQTNLLAVEEEAAGHAAALADFSDLEGLPVIIGTLHSQLGAAAAVFKKTAGIKARIAYVMTDRAALPLALSEQVRELKRKQLIDLTITAGQAFGGDLEAVNIFSALAAAKEIAKADAAIVTMGVGVVGTETHLGFSGIEQGEIANAVYAMRGRPIAIPRLNFQDKRPRHQGLSDQTVAALGLACLVACDLPVPRMEPQRLEGIIKQLADSGLSAKHRVRIVSGDDTAEALEVFGLTPTTMKRGYDEEPEFFRAAGAAGYLAAKMLAKA